MTVRLMSHSNLDDRPLEKYVMLLPNEQCMTCPQTEHPKGIPKVKTFEKRGVLNAAKCYFFLSVSIGIGFAYLYQAKTPVSSAFPSAAKSSNSPGIF